MLALANVRQNDCLRLTVRHLHNIPPIDLYLWEPVGALISIVLSQMILGGRVYAVCYLYIPIYFFDSSSFPQIFGKNRVIAFVLGLALVVEVVLGGIAISTTSPPPPSAGPFGSTPPCGAVTGPFGWLVSFWVGKPPKKYPYNISFLRFL